MLFFYCRRLVGFDVEDVVGKRIENKYWISREEREREGESERRSDACCFPFAAGKGASVRVELSMRIMRHDESSSFKMLLFPSSVRQKGGSESQAATKTRQATVIRILVAG